MQCVVAREDRPLVMLREDGTAARGLFSLLESPPKFICINDGRPDAAANPQFAVSLDLCLHRLFPTPFERRVKVA